jgi:hypothetical protein
MNFKKIIFFIFVYPVIISCQGQINLLDSCGLDSKTELNQYEITFFDSIYFAPIKTKKETIDPKNGFDFNNKKIAFYSCTKYSNTKGNGLLTKEEFFIFFRPELNGHAGRGIIVFNEKERKESNGFDAVVIISCPYDVIENEEIVRQLEVKYK